MSLAEEFGLVADELLSEFDERTDKVKLIRPGSHHFDEALGREVFDAATEHDLTGVASSYSSHLINGTTIQTGDIKFIATRAVKPELTDKVLMDGKTYLIVPPLKSNAYTGSDKVISYEIQLRG